MIAFIKGSVVSYDQEHVVIDHNGMGFEVKYAHTDRIHLDEDLMVYTYLHSTENDLSLFGFNSKNEKDLFMRLISVKGLGPKTAMGMLAKSNANAIIQSIETGDVTALKRLPGIGAKTASQIILDLKGKLVQSEDGASGSFNGEILDAMEALKNLGYRSKEVEKAAAYMNQEQGLTTEKYLKLGLQFLMKNGL